MQGTRTWRQDGFAARGRELGTPDEGTLGVEGVLGERSHGLAAPGVIQGHALGVGGADAAVALPVVPAHGLCCPAERLKHSNISPAALLLSGGCARENTVNGNALLLLAVVCTGRKSRGNNLPG